MQFLSSDTLWRSLISGLTGALHDRGLAGSFVFRRLGVRGQEPRQELLFDTDLGDEYSIIIIVNHMQKRASRQNSSLKPPIRPKKLWSWAEGSLETQIFILKNRWCWSLVLKYKQVLKWKSLKSGHTWLHIPFIYFALCTGKLTRLSNRLATVEANLCSPARSEIRNRYSGALTWLERWVRPVGIIYYTISQNYSILTTTTSCKIA